MALCRKFSTLQAQGHPKWREVNLGLPRLPRGWTYYGPTTREIRACLGKATSRASDIPRGPCSAEERILGLCH
jgi:hypothetical protein